MEKILITICGRAGSKGCKSKNLKSLLGVPLVYYPVAAARYLKENISDAEFDICVNSDSDDLISLARSADSSIEPIHRPDSLSGDTIGKLEVFKHSLLTMEERYGKKYDYLLDLDITSPLRSLESAVGVIKTMRSRPDAELTLSVCPSRRNPYFNMLVEKGDFVEKVIKVPMEARQQAPRVYDINGSIYILKSSFVRSDEPHLILDAKTVIYEMPDTAVLDIDSEEDFEFMQLVASYLFEKRPELKAAYEAAKALLRQE